MEEKKLAEFHQEESGKEYAVGDVYLGTVKKVSNALNACFVDVGHEKDAFLHYLDLGSQFLSFQKFLSLLEQGKRKNADLRTFRNEAEIPKEGKVSDFLSKGQKVLVQIVKEPISTKGPRLTGELSFAGRFLVMVPFSDQVSVSRKIESNSERNRLKRLVNELKPKNYGFIIRTAAEGASSEDVAADIQDLVQRWNQSLSAISFTPPLRVVREVNRTTSIVRDMLSDDFASIVTDHDGIYQDIQQYLAVIAPDKKDILKLYKQKKSILEHYEIDKQLLNSFGKNITFKGGAYLIIEHTEAMHVIDVNSGNRGNVNDTQEEAVLQTNLEAADEIARQLRLRDMGGIIVIDFIDMYKASDRKLVYDRMALAMQRDRAKHTLLPISKFGLMQITRQRVRPETEVSTQEVCPTCEGTGQIRSTQVLSDQIESQIDYLIKNQNESKILIKASPYIAAFLKFGWKSKQVEWLLKYGKWIKVHSDKSFSMSEYRFFRNQEEEILMM